MRASKRLALSHALLRAWTGTPLSNVESIPCMRIVGRRDVPNSLEIGSVACYRSRRGLPQINSTEGGGQHLRSPERGRVEL